jgi:hypothetical protein
MHPIWESLGLNLQIHRFSIYAVNSAGTKWETVVNATVSTSGKTTPVITWANPVPISSGTALSATQLNATASVPGTFVYTPPAGTVLSAGTQTLTTRFTPTDTSLYNTATKSISITVTSAGGCSAPGSAGVTVCAPLNNSTVISPVQVEASATITGTLARMEVWVDGVKKFTETTSKFFTTSLTLAAGKHRFDFYAVNTAGTKWETTVYSTVE